MKQSYSTRTALERTPAYEGATIMDADLILEGGAMRGQFTAGVLDFSWTTESGAKTSTERARARSTDTDYITGELGRTCYLNTKYCTDSRYLSMRNFALTGSALRRDFMFDAIPNVLDPFDYDAFRNSPMNLTTVASDVETGEADYHTMEEARSEREISYLQASASMPLVSKIIEVDGKKLLDGGTCDSVPLLRSMLDHRSNKRIVVLTQDETYVKGPNKTMPLARRIYGDYPLFLERMEYRHVEYNRTYRWIKRLHDAGEVFMIQPAEPVTISNMEKEPEAVRFVRAGIRRGRTLLRRPDGVPEALIRPKTLHAFKAPVGTDSR